MLQKLISEDGYVCAWYEVLLRGQRRGFAGWGLRLLGILLSSCVTRREEERRGDREDGGEEGGIKGEG